jgi:hypothetical protein
MSVAESSGSPELSEIVVAPVGTSSSFLADDLGVFRWTLSGMAPVAEEVVIPKAPTESFIAYADSCPRIAADLLAEYVTDTILRIDPAALVDVHVLMKLDLIIVSGEVGCSHPAKNAIVHSDQFLNTLNSSVRELLGTIGIKSPPVSLPNTTVSPSTTNTPNNEASLLYPEDEIDPVTCHIVLAITPMFGNEQAGQGSGVSYSKHLLDSPVVCRGSASSDPMVVESQKIANELQKQISRHIRGAAVDVTWTVGGDRVDSIDVSFCSPRMHVLIPQLANSTLGTPNLLALSSAVSDYTAVTVKCINRIRSTAVSSPYVGKDWNHPQRYGPILAKLEALNLVQSGACKTCTVELTFGPTIQRVVIYTPDVAGEELVNLEKAVKERCMSRTSSSIIKECFSSTIGTEFFMINHGGSRYALDFISGAMHTSEPRANA